MSGRDELSGAVYREVFDGLDDGLVLLDPGTGRITDTNDAFAALIGVPRESLLDRRLASVSNNDDRSAVASAVARLERAAAGEPQAFGWTDRTRSGETVELEVRLSPVSVDGTRLVLGVARDVTADRERERALVRRTERLEEFAGVVSHDLRGPLNVIEGELRRYRETGTTEHLDAVEAASAHLDRVVADLLDLARDGRTIGERETVPLGAVARRAWGLVDERGATLEVTGDLTVRADPGRLTRALENLFRNSVEHGSTSNRTEPDDAVEHGSRSDLTEPDDAVEHGSTSSRPRAHEDTEEHGSGRDRLSGEAHGDRADELEVRVGPLDDGRGFFVADDGTGFPPATRERAFDPGFTTVADGTGLGLAIVHRIFEAHGWSVRAEESRDGGARFEVRGVTPVARPGR
ncbi:MAG: PAS domain-containing sensor histidine kinase [Haloarculaceae archaeon]